ncbi:FAD-dependent oxidoreductase [Clostridium sp. cel8]|jgi:L-2-hydroxyglutarate oxidase LhgO|uniref:NAD(P)/FAD-dependent oxidoreductase n=1 Tax=unclassified Clostridium TaxID=2614128 RepID=UPI0015F6A541|nr:FAD-dependent oxidoreductase [Clostridium sp. cel8]MBA5851841.1 FAD-dependent oxidoreductase [Clostridium sp. cel8]
MDYDVLILGGGIIGCSVAYELSKYSLNIALIEKDYDIADDVALINAAVVYDGTECENTLLSRLESMGNSIIREIAPKFNINFEEKGYFITSDNENRKDDIKTIYNRALRNGIKNIHMLNRDQVLNIDPNLNMRIDKAIYSKNMGIISPYDLAISYGEIAFDNGVNFKMGEEVLNIESMSKGFKVVTNKNKFTCSMVLTTIQGKYYNLDKNDRRVRKKKYISYYFIDNIQNLYKSNNISSILMEDYSKIYIIPTQNNGLMVEINTDEDIDYECGLKIIEGYIGKIDENNVNIFYKSKYYDDDLIIDDSLIDKGYIRVLENHRGQITMTPAIAKIVCESIVNNLNCVPKKDFIDKRREFYRFRDISNDKRREIIKLNKKYGKIICYCENVTEGEIIDSIRRPLGARTIEGIKRRTGATFGSCRGSRCLYKVADILARETNKNITDIVKDSSGSKILLSRIKEFDEI